MADVRPILLLVPAMAGVLAAAEPMPLLAPVFADRAVLQRGRPIALWGWSEPGAAVTAELAGAPGVQPAAAVAGADGRWQAALGPVGAGGPYELRVTGGGRSVTAHDVLVGEVWICSGQSNMEMAVKDAAGFPSEQAAADLPQVRHLRIERTAAAEPQALVRCAWQTATPQNVGGFSATAYFMARELQRSLQVPVGVVHSSWGGTCIEYWLSTTALATIPGREREAAQVQDLTRREAAQRAATGKEYPELITAWYAANDPGTAATPVWSAEACDDGAWTEVQLPASFERAAYVAPTFDGTIWVRRAITVPAEAAGKAAVLNLGGIDDHDTTWINGREVGSSELSCQPRRYAVPAGLLRAGVNTIAIRITDTAFAGGINGGPEAMNLVVQGAAAIPLAGAWRLRTGADLAKVPPLPVHLGPGCWPGALGNGMIAPLVPMTVAGFAWYQGESNASGGHRYRGLLQALVGEWRGCFQQGELPFLIVSLANHRPRAAQPGESAWADLREDQAQVARSVPKCGLAVAIDIGDAGNIHPVDKQTVGLRLALAARAIAYGEPIESSGPWYRGMAVEGSAIRLRFDHLGGGLAAADGKPLTGFAVAGEDRAFTWAEAHIDGDSVVVSSPAVTRPVAVRYAWADNPACNLVNRAGLPAVPFRTDDWPRPAATP